MGLYLLASGTLISDPQSREGAKGPFTTAMLCAEGDGLVLVSIIAFDSKAERLLEFAKGDPIAIAGRAKLTSWTGRDGTERRGISIVSDQIVAAKPRAPRARQPPTSPRSTAARVFYSAPRVSGRGSGLPADSVADLWAHALDGGRS